jgi:hypothetical protein
MPLAKMRSMGAGVGLAGHRLVQVVEAAPDQNSRSKARRCGCGCFRPKSLPKMTVQLASDADQQAGHHQLHDEARVQHELE